MSDVLIKKQGAIAAVMDEFKKSPTIAIRAKTRLENLSPVQSESTRIFVELVVKHPDPRVCTYKEYLGKPYYSIKYIKDGVEHVGYGTYDLDVLSQYLKDYFMLPTGPEIIRCKECEFWAKQQDSLQGRCALMGAYPTGNWFCGNAKRREHIMSDSIFYDDDGGRICYQCGGQVGNDGYTNDVGEYYFCSFECFAKYMNETYGEGNWREREDENELGGFYDHFENGEWHPNGTFYTEWED